MPMAISRGAIIEPKSANCAGRKSETMSSLSPLPTSSPFLSPLALVEAFARRNCSSLSVHSGAGKKVVAPTGVAEDSWIEDKEVEARVRAIADVVGEPRVAQRASLAEAEWDEERAAAKVTRAVGKHWETFGHSESGDLLLYPEEALFLFECNHLALRHGDVPISVQQAYALCLRSRRAFAEYVAFSQLVRMGYRVRRSTRRRHADVVPVITLESNDSVPERIRELEACLEQPGPSWLGGLVDREAKRLKKRAVQDDCSDPGAKKAKTAKTAVTNDNGNYDEVQVITEGDFSRSKALQMLPNLIKRTRVTLSVPSSELLPFRSWPKKTSYTFDVVKTMRWEDELQQESSANKAKKRIVPRSVKTWADYRRFAADDEKRCTESRVDALVGDKMEFIEVPGLGRKEGFVVYDKKKGRRFFACNSRGECGKESIERVKRDGKREKFLERHPGIKVLVPSRLFPGHKQLKETKGARTINENARMAIWRDWRKRGPPCGFSMNWVSFEEQNLCNRVRKRIFQEELNSGGPFAVQDRTGKMHVFGPRWILYKPIFNLGQTKKADAVGMSGQAHSHRQSEEEGKKENDNSCKSVDTSRHPDDQHQPQEAEVMDDESPASPDSVTIVSCSSSVSSSVPEEVVLDSDDDVVESDPSDDPGGGPDVVESEAQSEYDPLSEGPLAALWTGRTRPLMQPKDAQDTATIMKKITLPSNLPAYDGLDSELAVRYDVYAPGVHFKKTSPGVPSYSVAVLQPGEAVPNDRLMSGLLRSSGDVPLMVAFVSHNGSVAFYNFSDISLPVDVTMG